VPTPRSTKFNDNGSFEFIDLKACRFDVFVSVTHRHEIIFSRASSRQCFWQLKLVHFGILFWRTLTGCGKREGTSYWIKRRDVQMF